MCKEAGEKWNRTHKLEHEHILSGLIQCPICGAGLAGTVRRRMNKKTGTSKEDFYYRCLHRKKIDEDQYCNYRLSLNEDDVNRQVEELVLDMVNERSFAAFIKESLEKKVDVSELEQERGQLRGQLRQLTGAKNKLSQSLDTLDISDRHYDRKYQDMQERLDNLYDKINDVEDSIADVNQKITAAYGEHMTAQQLYRLLEHFDKLYGKMTDLEKKEFFQNFIESIEIYPDRKANERILKQIGFRFPVYYNGASGDIIRLRAENADETVVLMSRIQA